MVEVTMSIEEYEALMSMIRDVNQVIPIGTLEAPKTKKKSISKYRRTYNRNFRNLQNDYKTKNGKWKKDGFKRAVRASHRKTKSDLK